MLFRSLVRLCDGNIISSVFWYTVEWICFQISFACQKNCNKLGR